MSEVPRLEILAVSGMPQIRDGDDLAELIVKALGQTGTTLRDGDVVVVSSKVVSKAEGRIAVAASRERAIDDQTRRIVAERVSPRGVTRIVESRSGPILAAAGVDVSNVPPGTVLLLPEIPDASARALRSALESAAQVQLGVIISDTAGRPWRDGQIDLAIGAAGVRVTDDLRGGTDMFGTPLEVTVRALADELACAADLVKGKLAGIPVAVVRGLEALVTAEAGPGAAALLRADDADWFSLGPVEAVRSALGVPPGITDVPPQPLFPGDTRERLGRAVVVATAATDPSLTPTGHLTISDVTVSDPAASDPAASDPATQAPDAAQVAITPPEDGVLGVADAIALGALVQRILTAAWAEGLTATCQVDSDGRALVVARVTTVQPPLERGHAR